MAGSRSALPTPGSETIFSRMTALASEHHAINLGQGFPDTDPPEHVLAAAEDAIRSGLNQYPPTRGLPQLLDAVRSHYSEFHGLTLASDGVTATFGATEALAAALMAFTRPGDEVVMFEPYYDAYAAMTERVGAQRRTVPLKFPDFSLEVEALRSAVSERTAVIIVNNPHNPTGKVFTRSELQTIGDIAASVDAIVVADEVYEHLAYAPARFVPAASVSELANRTLSISSGGKTFAATGWKVGWAYGPTDLVGAVADVVQYLTFAGGGPFQVGIAAGLTGRKSYFRDLNFSMLQRRDFVLEELARAGFNAVTPQGGYFVLADAAPLGMTNASDFALSLPPDAGVVAVPASVFCDSPATTGMSSVMRFALCKQEDVLREGMRRLVNTYGK